MNNSILEVAEELRTAQFYYGTRADLEPGELIEPSIRQDVGEQEHMASYVYLTPNLDAAIWAAEIAAGDGPARVYIVEPLGQIENAAATKGYQPPGHPSMSLRSRTPLRVVCEVTTWSLYHGTRADLKPGDLIKPGHLPNFGKKDRTTTYAYLTRTLDAATWGAELAVGDGPGRIYIVEPTGAIEEDPNLTNTKFRGNPTKSYRSQAPLRVIGEITDWQGHPPEILKTMKAGLAQLAQLGVEPLDD